MKNIAQKTAEILLDIKAIEIRPKNPFRFTSGILSPIYIDNRIIISYPKVRRKIINFYIKVLKELIGLNKIDLFSGTATAAIPHAAFISQKLNLPMVYVRGNKKGHGKENQIEGIVKKSQKVIIIEDHISTGGSAVGNVRAIRKAGGKAKYILATTTYSMKKAQNQFKKLKIKTISLTNLETIIDVAIKKKYIKEKDKSLILEWSKNPKIWGKKFGFKK